MQQGETDPEVALLPLLSGTGCFLDVGANIGSWTGPASRIFSHVHAFEPDPDLSRALKRVGQTNITVHRLALSNRVGTARFSVPLHEGGKLKTRGTLESTANEGFRQEYYEVPVTTLDTLDLRGIDAMKIDVEGHEEALLDGAKATIDRERPSMIIEIEERHHPGRSDHLMTSILDRNYTAFFLRGGKMEHYRPGLIYELQPENLVPTPGGARSEDYINNFIFIPREKSAQLNTVGDWNPRK